MPVNGMDKVTQQNAANAEESASASEEMNDQAHQMQFMVHELVGLVGHKGHGAAKGPVVAKAHKGRHPNGICITGKKDPRKRSGFSPGKASEARAGDSYG